MNQDHHIFQQTPFSTCLLVYLYFYVVFPVPFLQIEAAAFVQIFIVFVVFPEFAQLLCFETWVHCD